MSSHLSRRNLLKVSAPLVLCPMAAQANFNAIGFFLSSSPPVPPNPNTWSAMTNTNAPAARSGPCSHWTGSEMIIWGGAGNLNTGGRYNPTSDTWTATSTTGATGRIEFASVWTGTELIIWGGRNGSYLNSGQRYNPSTDSWTTMSTVNAPSARSTSAVWTGSKMIVWGGYNGSVRGDGKIYDPTTDTWSNMSSSGAPSARVPGIQVWTGSKMVIWSGFTGAAYAGDGKIYDPDLDTWTAMNTSGAPPDYRFLKSSLWIGDRIFFGNYSFDPMANSWSTLTSVNMPTIMTAVWTGTQVITWGTDNLTALIEAGKYDPVTDTWTTFNYPGAPSSRWGHSAVWTGNKMLIWGGRYNSTYFSTGGILS